MDEVTLSADRSGRPLVVRVGATVRRPAGPGSALVAMLLQHLESVGFDGSPRFLGHDDDGRQVLSYIEGDVSVGPSWQQDDAENARQLGRVARLLRTLHDATADFEAPPDLAPARALPLPGAVWTHGDVGYQNLVYRDGDPFAFIDWEFAAPADVTCDLAGLLALGVRAPRPDADDNDRRGRAVSLANEALILGYGLDAEAAARLPAAAATVLDDAANFWTELEHDAEMIAAARWRADWFRTTFDR